MPEEKRIPQRREDVLETVPQIAVPWGRLFDQFGYLRLHGADQPVYLYCCYLANISKNNGAFPFAAADASRAVNRGRSTVLGAMVNLQDNKSGKTPLLVRAEKYPKGWYAIATPTGEALCEKCQDKGKTLREAMVATGTYYDKVPAHVVQNMDKCEGAALAVVLTGIKQAQMEHSADYTAVIAEWTKRAGSFKVKTVRDAWSNEVVKSLLHVKYKAGSRSRTAHVELFHPINGTSLTLVRPAALDRDADRKISAYDQDKADSQPEFAPNEVVAWLRSKFPEIEFRNDEWYVYCPKCKGRQGVKATTKPTLRISFNNDPTGLGYMNCRSRTRKEHGHDVYCDYLTKNKRAYHLVAEVENITPGKALEQMRQFIYNMRGVMANVSI